MKQRVDAYSSHVPAHDYSILNPFELLEEVCQLSRRLLSSDCQPQVDVSAHQASHFLSNGLSRISDLDSGLYLSKKDQPDASSPHAGQVLQAKQPGAFPLDSSLHGPSQPSKGVLLQTKQDLE